MDKVMDMPAVVKNLEFIDEPYSCLAYLEATWDLLDQAKRYQDYLHDIGLATGKEPWISVDDVEDFQRELVDLMEVQRAEIRKR